MCVSPSINNRDKQKAQLVQKQLDHLQQQETHAMQSEVEGVEPVEDVKDKKYSKKWKALSGSFAFMPIDTTFARCCLEFDHSTTRVSCTPRVPQRVWHHVYMSHGDMLCISRNKDGRHLSKSYSKNTFSLQ